MDQVVQIIGALLILSGYAANQFGLLDARSVTYLVLNTAGSAILAVLGYYERQWGFFLLEGVWAIVSVCGLYRYLTASQAPRVDDISR